MDSHYCDIEEFLVEAGLRNTKQKHALIEVVHEGPFTVRQLLKELGSRWGTKSTAHRILSQLEAADFLYKAFDDHGETYYERTTKDHHDHFQCLACKTYQCVPCPEPKAEPQKAKVLSHHLIFRGVCLKCV